MKKLMINSIIVFILLISFTHAIGVVPSHKNIVFEPGKEETIQLKITNNEEYEVKVVIYAEEGLSQYIEIAESLIDLKKQESKVISYTINMPEKIDKPGEHETKIYIRAVKDTGKESEISSELGVISKLNVKVPYPGKYAEIKLFVPSFEKKKSSNFAIEIFNLGQEDIVEAKGFIDIYGPLNDKIITLKSGAVLIKSKERKIVNIPWEADINPGKYFVKATVIYDGLNAFDNKPLFIGSSEITIDSISVDKFKLGAIAQFDILFSNNWNENIKDIYADIKILDKENNALALSKTSSADIEAYGKQELKAYWDTKNVQQGDYSLEITMHYLGKQAQKVYDIYVSLDEIVTKGLGRVVETQEVKEDIPKSVIILSILVAILVIVNVFLIFFKFRKKSK